MAGKLLQPFREVARGLGEEYVEGHGGGNRFDPGFDLPGTQHWFEFGDLRVTKPDREVVVEVETGGGLTNLVKYWPLSELHPSPLLLLHVFATGTPNNYVSHVRLWEFTWQKIVSDAWTRNPPMLFARKFQLTGDDDEGLHQACKAMRDCLLLPLPEVMVRVFQYRGPQ